MSDTAALKRQEWGEHWTLVMAASIGFAFSSILTASTGIFMEPLGKEFGWSRTLLSSGISITSAITALLSPLFGMLIDRWGTRRMALAGIMLGALTIAALSQLNGSSTQWIGFWAFYSIAALLIKSTVWSAAVSSVFDAGRGLALGLTLSGTALASGIVPPLANYLIDAYGWRGAYVWLGLGGGALALITSAIWLFDGYDVARRKRAEGDAGGPLLTMPGLTMAEAWRDRALWRIAISTFVMMVITIALTVHQFPILTEAGVDRTAAAWYASIAGFTGIAGKLVTGWLLDRYHARWVGSLTLAITTLTFAILLYGSNSPGPVVLAMVINGYAAGTKLQLASYLTSAYGGMRHFGAIFGTIASLIAAGSGLGPLVGGLVFDHFGNYDPFLWFGLVGTLFSSWLILGLGDYPKWRKDDAAQAFA